MVKKALKYSKVENEQANRCQMDTAILYPSFARQNYF